MNARPDSLYRAMVATGDDPDAPERVRVDHRGDRAVITLDESDRLNGSDAWGSRMLSRLRRALSFEMTIAEWIGMAVMLAVRSCKFRGRRWATASPRARWIPAIC